MRTKSANSRGSKSKNRIFKFIIAGIFVIAFLWCGATFVNQSADISRMEQQKEQLNTQLAAQKEENEKLQEIVNSDDKDEYIEQKAREKGYVKDGEVVFYDISGSE